MLQQVQLFNEIEHRHVFIAPSYVVIYPRRATKFPRPEARKLQATRVQKLMHAARLLQGWQELPSCKKTGAPVYGTSYYLPPWLNGSHMELAGSTFGSSCTRGYKMCITLLYELRFAMHI